MQHCGVFVLCVWVVLGEGGGGLVRGGGRGVRVAPAGDPQGCMHSK